MSASDQPDTESRPPAPASRPVRPFLWSLRREIWEHRAVYMAPLIAAALVLSGTMISGAHRLPAAIRARMAESGGHPPAHGLSITFLPYAIGAMAIMAAWLVVAAFFCLGALYNERRDRSLLFWKSMPISDLTAVLAKLAVPMAVQPAIAWVIVVVLQALMRIVSDLALLSHGVGLAGVWADAPLLNIWTLAAYGFAAMSLWYAPFWGWLLLVSAWAKRAPFLWAFGVPLALVLFERVAFNSALLGGFLKQRFHGGFAAAFSGDGDNPAAMDLNQIDPVKFVTTPGLWTGLVFAAACLAGAVWLRRRREAV